MRCTDLVFDLYGTLVDIHTDENETVWEKTALYFGFYGADYSGDTLKEAFHLLMEQREASAGQNYECFPDIPFEEVLADLFRAKGVSENADALGLNAAQIFRITSIDYIRVYPHVKEALTTLRRKGFRLWLLSNAQHVFTAYELRLLGLDSLFDGVMLSSDYLCRKPDHRFYQALFSKYGLNPQQCLMIGNDRETDIAGAIAAGMATLYLHTNLTPPAQREASPALHPQTSPQNGRHYEYEGSDWLVLTQLLIEMQNDECIQ